MKARLAKVRQRLKNGEKFRVAFLVIYDSTFSAKSLYEKMLKDDMFEPFLVIIPDIVRGKEHMLFNYQKTYKMLSDRYQNVKLAYHNETDTFLDISEMCDLCISATPYSEMSHWLYSVEYLLQRGVLSFSISYGYMPDFYGRDIIMNLPSMNACWKVFVDTKENYEDYIKYTKINGINGVLSGYCKMDRLANLKKIERNRKKIIIAPHHTVNHPNFSLSNFLIYAEFFNKLPKLYPNVDFVFRPHPLLYPTLCQDSVWGKEKTDAYFEEIQKNDNLIWQNGGDYFETFVNSDGIIHDCSSFLVEYLFTGHPACYMLRDKKEIESIFVDLGKNCLKHYYQAFNEQQILDFIDNVVIGENDPLKKQREQYVNDHLKINYPHVADFILHNLKESLQ